MNTRDIVASDPAGGQKQKPNLRGGEIRFSKNHSESTLTMHSQNSSYLQTPTAAQQKSLQLRVEPVVSEENLLWEDGKSPTVDLKEKDPNRYQSDGKPKIRTFHLDSNWTSEWGMLINFTQHWTEWRIRKVEQGYQGATKGIKPNWYLVGVNDKDLTAETANQVKQILMNGNSCDIRLSQEQPYKFMNYDSSPLPTQLNADVHR